MHPQGITKKIQDKLGTIHGAKLHLGKLCMVIYEKLYEGKTCTSDLFATMSGKNAHIID